MFFSLLSCLLGASAISVTTMDPAQATALGLALVGTDPGLALLSATYSGAAVAAGAYSQGPQSIANGIILSTGMAADASLPENQRADTINNGTATDFCTLALPGPTYFDGALLTVTVSVDRTKYNGISSSLIFATEEYPNFVGSKFNDIVAFFVDGTQYAKDANGSVININGGFFSQADVVTNTSLVYDGSTKVLGLTAPLGNTTALTTTHIIQLTICDAGDPDYDSAVLLATLVGTSCAPNCVPGLQINSITTSSSSVASSSSSTISSSTSSAVTSPTSSSSGSEPSTSSVRFGNTTNSIMSTSQSAIGGATIGPTAAATTSSIILPSIITTTVTSTVQVGVVINVFVAVLVIVSVPISFSSVDLQVLVDGQARSIAVNIPVTAATRTLSILGSYTPPANAPINYQAVVAVPIVSTVIVGTEAIATTKISMFTGYNVLPTDTALNIQTVAGTLSPIQTPSSGTTRVSNGQSVVLGSSMSAATVASNTGLPAQLAAGSKIVLFPGYSLFFVGMTTLLLLGFTIPLL